MSRNRELESFFMHFIDVEDGSYRYGPDDPPPFKRTWGWRVDANPQGFHGHEGMQIEYMGVAGSQLAATNAAVEYIWRQRPDIVRMSEKELELSCAYNRK